MACSCHEASPLFLRERFDLSNSTQEIVHMGPLYSQIFRSNRHHFKAQCSYDLPPSCTGWTQSCSDAIVRHCQEADASAGLSANCDYRRGNFDGFYPAPYW